LVVAIVLATDLAGAAPADPAEPLIEQGVKLRTEGRHAEALELFQKANAASPSARTLAQMGLAEGSLKRWTDAEAHLVAALDAHDTPWIENRRNREALEQALTAVRAHIGTLLIVGPASIEVALDGKPLGRLPLAGPLRVAEGPIQVRGTAPGHRPTNVDATISGATETTVTLDLGPALPPPLPAAPIIDDEPLIASPPNGGAWKTWTGASLLAVSAAALVTGAVWLAVDGNGTCDPPAGARCLRVYDTKTSGWVALAVGGAAGVGGGILLWKGRHTDASVALAPGLLSVGGRF
jgi:hypothetical protein